MFIFTSSTKIIKLLALLLFQLNLVKLHLAQNGNINIDEQFFRFDYTFYPELDGWLKLHRIPATWHDARLRCYLEGAALASPLNTKLLTAMKNFSIEVLTGVHSTISKGDYFSVEGVPLARMPIKWAPGEPDNCENSEECLLLQSHGTVADVKCSEVFPFICYKKRTKPAIITDCGTTDIEYTHDSRTGSCYKFHYVGRSWPRAFMACASEGGHLAIINSDVEAQILKELFAKYPEHKISAVKKNLAHVGFYDWGERGVWSTIHGQSLREAGYESWGKWQPDNATAEYCGSMFKDSLLNDIWCHCIAPFICEKKPENLLPYDSDN
ncbi:unnamed protein product [Parnassius apollo]|uniref:(apollo) hypothetical protein n=1 Tax=Parnassius apollo TaxID=110799 RepID=A0A8S3YFT7_PARAO|nr:unnamed protein product [Parnassius apollo]